MRTDNKSAGVKPSLHVLRDHNQQEKVQMEDSAIVALYWDRNESALRETSEKYGRYLMKIAWNILADREDSEESVNDTYLHAWNAMPPHRPQVLSTFLGKITRHLSIDIYRKRHSAKRGGSEYALSMDELTDCVPGGGSPEEAIEARELAGSINRFLKELTPEARKLFVCRYYYFDPLADAASSLGMTEGKAKTLLFRTRRKLKEYLEKEGYVL